MFICSIAFNIFDRSRFGCVHVHFVIHLYSKASKTLVRHLVYLYLEMLLMQFYYVSSDYCQQISKDHNYMKNKS